MANQTDHSGMLEDLKFKTMIGSGLLGGMYNLSSTVAYGRNMRIAEKLLPAQAKHFGILNQYARGDALVGAGKASWISNIPGNSKFSYGTDTYGVLRQTPENFAKHVSRNIGRSPETSKLYNNIVSTQSKFFRGRQKEAIRRLANKTVTMGGKKTTLGYFNKSIWKLAASKNRNLTGVLAKAALGKTAALTSKVLMAGWQVGLLYEVGSSTVKYLRESGRNASKLNFGTPFQTTEGLYTERQRALQAITSSRMSTRSAIGGEAQLMHR